MKNSDRPTFLGKRLEVISRADLEELKRGLKMLRSGS